jgi:DNA-binding IclR family transcriptional regulator
MDVKTAGRTVEIFETFAQSQEPLSLSEISRALNAPLSSCLYLVRALENRGYLYAVGARKHLYPTRKLFDIAKAIAVGESWIERIEPELVELRNVTRETVILGKRQGNKVVYLAIYEGPQTIRYSSSVGELKPLHSSSIGKALLSVLDATERKKLITKLSLDAITAATITDPIALAKDIKKAAELGHAVTRGENVADVMAIAKPLLLGKEYYGLAIAGPLYRIGAEAEHHIQCLDRTCKAVEASL